MKPKKTEAKEGFKMVELQVE